MWVSDRRFRKSFNEPDGIVDDLESCGDDSRSREGVEICIGNNFISELLCEDFERSGDDPSQSFREAHFEKLDLWKLHFRAGSSKIELLKKSMF